MASLSFSLDLGFRQAASLVIEVGTDRHDIGDLADMVASVEVMTGRTEAATGTITIDDRRREDGEWMAADSGHFRRNQPIVLSADFQTHVEEIFRGYMVQLKPELPQNGGEAKLVIEVQDDGVALNREHMRRVWGEDAPMTDLEILRELVEPLNLDVDPASGDGQSARSLSMDGTPAQFLYSRAQANGYELIFSEGGVYFGPMRLEGDAQETIMIYAGSATNCLSWSLTDDAQKPDAVGFELAPREEGADPVVEVVTPDAPLLGTSATAEEGADLGTPSISRISREGDEPEEVTRARAQAAANENSFKIRATGELDGTLYGHVLKAGKLVRVDGTGTRNGGLYYADKVTHAFSPEGYRQRFELIRNATGDSDSLGSAPLASAMSAISNLF
ncbi:phage late control D family protein [Kordiimonas marina]|uniref:phage late control D family protein n=1 Tax=Kordiimonas marina TaxID=2872312 RepID=UPI001FF48DB8|nr:hypothetical protein [Kordiimonas marina]MCJ9429314.1 hypothetical protein [Kordiimonas marina]